MISLDEVIKTSARHGDFVGRTRAEEDTYYATFAEPLFEAPTWFSALFAVLGDRALAPRRRLRPSSAA